MGILRAQDMDAEGWAIGYNLRSMNREHYRQYSHELGRDMESLVFGHAGRPILVFPTSMGRFFEYEDAGMIRALAGKLEAGEIQVFCVDGVDGEEDVVGEAGQRGWRKLVQQGNASGSADLAACAV